MSSACGIDLAIPHRAEELRTGLNAQCIGYLLTARVRIDQFERGGHLAYVPMPGGAAAIKEPWRMAVSYLQNAYGKDFHEQGLPGLKEIEIEV